MWRVLGCSTAVPVSNKVSCVYQVQQCNWEELEGRIAEAAFMMRMTFAQITLAEHGEQQYNAQLDQEVAMEHCTTWS